MPATFVNGARIDSGASGSVSFTPGAANVVLVFARINVYNDPAADNSFLFLQSSGNTGVVNYCNLYRFAAGGGSPSISPFTGSGNAIIGSWNGVTVESAADYGAQR